MTVWVNKYYPEIGNLGSQKNPKNRLKASWRPGFSTFFAKLFEIIFDDFTKFRAKPSVCKLVLHSEK